MSQNSSWTLTQTGEARTWTLTQDGESRTFTIAPGVGPAGPAGPSNITTATETDITGILKGDGANVGAAVADTDYQSVPAEGAFADGDKTKLDGIEAGADVTDATNVDAAGAVMESDYSPAHSVLAQQSGTGSPSAVTLGTNSILGRTTGAGTSITGLSASDVRTMLNVEDGATADQTDAEILAAVESESGRDMSVDGAKLDGIEAGATADQTASEILTAIKTVDGTGSGLDADLLDGQEASAFAAASHTHLSADITDATDDGSVLADRGKILKTDSSGQVKALGVFGDLSVSGGIGLIDGDPDGSFTNYGIMVGNNITGGRTIELPDADGTLALTSQTDGSIHAEDLDFAGSTEIGADLADADEILVSDGGGNTTRRKSLVSRIWTYIKAKIDAGVTWAGAQSFSGQVELTGQAASTDDSAMTRSLSDTRYGQKLRVSKTAATSRNTTTTLADDPDLVLTFPETGEYLLRIQFSTYDNSTGGFKYDFAGTATYGVRQRLRGSTIANWTAITSSSPAATMPSEDVSPWANSTRVGYWQGVIYVTATGTITFRWAQNTSNANNTQVHAGSYMTLEKLD